MITCNGQCYHSTAIWIYTGWSFLIFLIPKRPSNKKLIKSYVRWYQFLNLALDQLLVSKFLGLDQLPVLRGVHFLFNLIIFPISLILFWIFSKIPVFFSALQVYEKRIMNLPGQFWILATGLKVCGRKLLEESSSEPASQNFFKLSFSNYLLSRPPRTSAFIQFIQAIFKYSIK